MCMLQWAGARSRGCRKRGDGWSRNCAAGRADECHRASLYKPAAASTTPDLVCRPQAPAQGPETGAESREEGKETGSALLLPLTTAAKKARNVFTAAP